MDDADQVQLATEIPLPFGCPSCGHGKLTDRADRDSLWRWLCSKVGLPYGRSFREKSIVRYESDTGSADGQLKCAWCQEEFLIRAMRGGNSRSTDGQAEFHWGSLISAMRFQQAGEKTRAILDSTYIVGCPKCRTTGSLYYSTQGMRIEREEGVCRHCGHIHSQSDYSGDTWD
jgi:DNA-directed RNA polymerase subunit M/transcription elongation factor TFIIS